MYNNVNLISVIVPCYNQAQYLDECLQSVLDQTYQNWECIIVNDGSPDNTEEIVNKWTAKDNRFKYLLKTNGGLSSARNAGIEIANGEWILPLDSDDRIGVQYLELAAKEFDKGYSIIYCKAELFGEEEGEWIFPEYSYSSLLASNQIFCSAFYKKEDWLKFGKYDETMKIGYEDWEFWIRLLKGKQNEVHRINSIQFYYRIKKQSMLKSINLEKENIVRSYIYNKNMETYNQKFGNYISLLNDKNIIEEELMIYKKVYTSKRYKLGNKLVEFFEKLRII